MSRRLTVFGASKGARRTPAGGDPFVLAAAATTITGTETSPAASPSDDLLSATGCTVIIVVHPTLQSLVYSPYARM